MLSVVRGGAGSVTVVKVSGVVDDSFDRVAFAEPLTGTALVDLEEVRRITSYGAREWALALRSVTPGYLGIINVRPPVVAMFNMVKGFAGRGQLLTFYSPYLCEECGKELELLVDLRTRYQEIKAGEADREVPCPSCGGKAQFDDVANAYFFYALSQPPPEPPPEVSQFLDRPAGTP